MLDDPFVDDARDAGEKLATDLPVDLRGKEMQASAQVSSNSSLAETAGPAGQAGSSFTGRQHLRSRITGVVAECRLNSAQCDHSLFSVDELPSGVKGAPAPGIAGFEPIAGSNIVEDAPGGHSREFVSL